MSGSCGAAQLASSRQMGGQVSRGSVAEYQADEWAEVARLRWRGYQYFSLNFLEILYLTFSFTNCP